VLLLESSLVLAAMVGAFAFSSPGSRCFEKLERRFSQLLRQRTLSDKVQKNESPKLPQQNRGCVLVSRDMYCFFRQFAVSPGNDELLSEIQRTMRPIFTLQDLTLYRSSQRPEISSDE